MRLRLLGVQAKRLSDLLNGLLGGLLALIGHDRLCVDDVILVISSYALLLGLRSDFFLFVVIGKVGQ